MWHLTVDQFEFDHPHTEEWLEIAIETKTRSKRSADLMMFVSRTVPHARSDMVGTELPFEPLRSMAREYLPRFANVEVPAECNWSYCEITVPDAVGIYEHMVIDAGDRFIYFQYGSSA